MKTEYRIKQIGNKFYPQKKSFLFWKNIRVYMCTTRYGDITVYGRSKKVLCLNLIDDAKRALRRYKNNYLGSFVVKGHLVKTFYNEYNNDFVYIDMLTVDQGNTKYSNSSGDLCAWIGDYEYQLKRKREIETKVTIHEFRED